MSDDLSDEFLTRTAATAAANDSSEMEQWLADFKAGDKATVPPLVDPVHQYSVRAHDLPQPKPQRRETDDPLGRIPVDEPSTAGTIVRNVAEIPGQAAKGVHDAVMNSVGWAIDPLARWLNENVADLTYKLPEAKTGTGAVAHGVSQFLTGFVPALKALKAAGVTGKVTGPAAAGAVSDFLTRDPHEGRLSDLWKQAGLPNNILTDLLSSKPNDSAIEGRAKNAMEGVGLGYATEGVLLAARMIRSARNVKGAVKNEEEFLKGKYGEINGEHFHLLGDPTKPAIETRVVSPPVSPGKIKKALDNTGTIEPRAIIRNTKKSADGLKSEDFETYVNFARFDEPDQVKFTIGKMAEAFKGQVDEARRGVITQEETKKMADDLGMSVAELLERRKGQPFNAEEALAARQLWAASGERLLQAAKAAADANAGPIDQFAFRKMMAVHAAIQSEVIGARTETARALASWAIPAGGSVEKARAIEQIMGAMGGPEASREMARRLAILAETGASPAAIARFANRGAAAMTHDAVKEAWINGLLSSPKTHVVNITSNSLVAFQQIYERGVAAGVRGFTGGEGVVAGEATAMAYGLIESYKDAWRLAAKALKTGETGFAFNKMEVSHPRAISSEAFRMSRDTGAGRFVDFLGGAVNIPGRLLGAEDEFFKTIGYRMELRAQSLRTATQEGHKGAALAQRVQELVDNPTEAVRINSADAAMYNTFTNEVGAFGRAVMNLRNIDSPLNPTFLVLPFIRTPVNIARYAFERTPFAPLVGQWRADIAAGGARADLALARMATGTSIMLVAMDMADRGLITGPGPKDADQREALMRQGWQPNSFVAGSRSFSYNRVDPLGMTVGFASAITEAVKHGEIDEEDVDEWQEVAAMTIAAVSQTAISKTYLEGFSKFVEVMSDPKRYSEKYIDDMVASFVPSTALSYSVKNLVDPVQREVGTPLEAIQARIAGLSDKLPPRRNLWGEKMTSESGFGRGYDALSPVASKPVIDSPVDQEITRLGDGPQRITKKAAFDGVKVNMKNFPGAYDDYTRLAGNDLKHPAWGMGAKDYLNAVVSGGHPMSSAYQVLSDEGRRGFIKNTIQQYRELAQREVLQNPAHRQFAEEVARMKQFRNEAKMPVLGGM